MSARHPPDNRWKRAGKAKDATSKACRALGFYPSLHQSNRPADGRAYIQIGRVEQVGIFGLSQWRDIAPRIARVPIQNVGQDMGIFDTTTFADELGKAPFGPEFRGGGHEQLGVRTRGNHGTNIAAVEDRAPGLPSKVELSFEQSLPHRRMCRHDGGRARCGFAPDIGVMQHGITEPAGAQGIDLMRGIAAVAQDR